MAIQRIPIIDWTIAPDNSGNVFFENADVKSTNKVWKRLVCIFKDSSTLDGLDGSFNVPPSYVSGANLILVWTATAIVGNYASVFDYRAVGGNDVESLDQAGVQQSVSSLDAAPTAINNRMQTSIPLTDGNFAPDDTVPYTFFRDGTAADTIADAIQLVGLFFEFADA